VSIDPQGYMLLVVLSYLPLPVQKIVRRSMLWTRRVIGLPRSNQ
jgi:hypothetical protein